jgi:hypothetical protein
MTDMSGSTRSPGPARQVGLGLVAFLATLILLAGLVSVIGRSPSGEAAPRPSSSAPAAAVSSQPLASVVASPSASAGPSASASAGASPSGSGGPSPSVGPSPTPSEDPVLVGAGDIADCALPGDSETAALLDTIPGTVFTAGDNAYPDGTLEQFERCYGPTWGRHLARTKPVPGNHDRNTKDLAGYLGYFGAAAAPNGTPWYSYTLGTWHVVVLDSNCDAAGGCGPDSAQGRWLAADLAASAATCTVAIWHHPRFSSGEHGNDGSTDPFWRALFAAGADVVVNGHDHDYERFAPQDPDGREDRERGIREFVAGTGGAELRGFPGSAANSELRMSVTHGVLRLVLHEASYEWTYIPTSGDLGDAGNAPCH